MLFCSKDESSVHTDCLNGICKPDNRERQEKIVFKSMNSEIW